MFRRTTRGKSCQPKSLLDAFAQRCCCWLWVLLHSLKQDARPPFDGWVLSTNWRLPFAIKFGLSELTTFVLQTVIVSSKLTLETVFARDSTTFAMVAMALSLPYLPSRIVASSSSVPKVRIALRRGTTATQRVSRRLVQRTLARITSCMSLD